jgi:hypothetical protein
MDTVPDREFIRIFERISTTISLKGCVTPEDIDRRLRHRMKEINRAIRHAEREETKQRLRRGYQLWSNLLKRRRRSRMNFPDRVIYEASKHPKGIVALTLIHGKAKAVRIYLRRQREKLGMRRFKIKQHR